MTTDSRPVLTTKSLCVGDKVIGEMVAIYAAVRNSDSSEGRGTNVDNSYHTTIADATIATHHIDVMGSDGKVQTRLALRLDDGRHFLFKDGKPVTISSDVEAKAKLREEALKKLSMPEMVALGLGER